MRWKRITPVTVSLGCLITAGIAFFCIRGIREEGSFCVVLTLDQPPGSHSIVGIDIPIRAAARGS